MRFDLSGLDLDQRVGPHVAFIRTRQFEEGTWDFVDLDQTPHIPGADNVIAVLRSLADVNLDAIPGWVEFLEIATVSPDMAHAPHSLGAEYPALHEDLEHDDGPSFGSIFRWLPLPAVTERPSFDRRLIVVCYGDDDTPEACEAHNRKIIRALSKRARGVWHGKDAFAAYFRDARSPAQIMASLSSVINEETVYDAAIFKVIQTLFPVGAPSILQAAIEDMQAGTPRS